MSESDVLLFRKRRFLQLDTNKVLEIIKNNEEKDFVPKMLEHVHTNSESPKNHSILFDSERGE